MRVTYLTGQEPVGFLTASTQPADLTTYTIDQLIVDLP